jgi:hypothetical protein
MGLQLPSVSFEDKRLTDRAWDLLKTAKRQLQVPIFHTKISKTFFEFLRSFLNGIWCKRAIRLAASTYDYRRALEWPNE